MADARLSRWVWIDVLMLVACAARPEAAPTKATAPGAKMRYPLARRGDLVEDHFGVRVADPYRGLEAVDTAETRSWVKAENALTDAFFAGTTGLEPMRARLGQLFRVEKFAQPRRAGGRSFWVYGDGKRDQPVIVTAAGFDAAPSVAVDPNVLTSGAGVQTLTTYAVAQNGARLAYGLASGGGDWETWHVRDVDAPADRPDALTGIKYYAPAFTRDGTGLYYSRFPTPKAGAELTETDHDCKVFFHRVGTSGADDVVIYEQPDHPTWQFDLWMSDDGRLLVLAIGDGQVGDRRQEQIVALDVSRPGAARPITIVDRFEAEFYPVGSAGPIIYLLTDLDAPTKRIVAVDTRAPARAKWREIVPAGPDAIFDAVTAGDVLLVTTLHDAHSAAVAYDLRGKKLYDIALPEVGTATFYGAARDAREALMQFTSFTVPGTIYRADLRTGALRPWKTPGVPFDAVKLETRQVTFASKDGTKVPMFVVARKGLPLDGSNPTVLTGYGGFGIPFLPGFDPAMIAWIERGGVYVVANIRGGGDFGEAWHLAAVRTHRQVAYDDFIAAAQALVAQKITSPAHLGIIGVSGGGQLVGAVLMQRPELFGAAVPIAGVLDMLRFQLFGQGAGWEGDLGSPEVPEEMRALYAYSPVHNVRPGTSYPPTFIITADHDVRVAPLHSYKLAAAMQAAQAGPAPVLLRVDTDSGHGGGGLLSQMIDQNAEILVFLGQALGLPQS